MGHMWELFTFYGWLGPFFVSSAIANGMNLISAGTQGGTYAAFAILMGVPSSWIWGVAADKYGPVKAICISSALSAINVDIRYVLRP